MLARHHGEETLGRDKSPGTASRPCEQSLRAEEAAELLGAIVASKLPRQGAEPRSLATREDHRRVSQTHACPDARAFARGADYSPFSEVVRSTVSAEPRAALERPSCR